MPKPSRRRLRTARAAARAPPPPMPGRAARATPASTTLCCALPGCENTQNLRACAACKKDLCAACIIFLARVLLCDDHEDREMNDWLVCYKCPFCRENMGISDFAQFGSGEQCVFKTVLASTGVRTHKLPSMCPCNRDVEVIVDHVACEGGCYECPESQIDFMVKQ